MPTNKLDDYLRLPVENITKLLKWWFDNRRTYPTLSCMARDYLSIPGGQHQVLHSCNYSNQSIQATSTAVEHAFSKGHQILQFTCNVLSSLSVCASLCLGAWCHSDLIISKDFLSAIHSGKQQQVKPVPSEVLEVDSEY